MVASQLDGRVRRPRRRRRRRPRARRRGVRAGRDAALGPPHRAGDRLGRSRPRCSRASSRTDATRRCATRSASARAAAMLFAKNSDRHPDEAQVVEWHDRRAAGGGAAHAVPDDRPTPDAHAFLGSRPTWLWGCRARRQRARRRDRQREDLDGRPPTRPAARRCSAWTSCASGSNGARTADEALDGHAPRCSSSTARADRASRTATSRTSRRSCRRPRRRLRRRDEQPHVGRAPGRRGRGDLESHQPRAPTGRARRPTSRPAPTSTTTAGRSMPTAIADQRLAVTTRRVAGADATTRADLARTLRSHGLDRARRAPGEIDADGSGFTRVHAPPRDPLADDRVDDRRAARRRAAARVGEPGQSVLQRLRAVLPARGPARARRRRRSGSASPGCATASRPTPDELGRGAAPRSPRSKPSCGPRPTAVHATGDHARLVRLRPHGVRARSTPRCIDSASDHPLRSPGP